MSLDLPSVLDLRQGQIEQMFSASVRDPDGVKQVTVYYDRPLSTSSGSYAFQIIHGWGDAWTDGQNSYTASVLPYNIAGPLNITHVEIEDNQGNSTRVESQALRDLGVDTSITVLNSEADVTPPVLTELVLPASIDLRQSHAVVEFSAAGTDDTEIDEVVIWFDRELGTSYHLSGGHAFNSFELVGIWGFGVDDWSDGSSSEALLFSKENASGTIYVEEVDITDVYGNTKTYSNADLRRLGFQSSFEVLSMNAPMLSTYATDFPDVITIREGQTIGMPLQFNGLSNHRFTYQYDVSAVGGTASNADIRSSSGSGSMSIVSTPPTSEFETIFVAAGKDDVVEQTETAYLTVRLSGDMTFPDGGSVRVVRIDILDDNVTVGSPGNDVLRGTSAAETLTGGRGNDRYVITAGDRVVEQENEGIDTVVSAFSHALTSNVENLVLTGTGTTNGIGNALNNRLIGNAGDNFLNGGRGEDSLEGGAGSDTYTVDTAGDRIVEAANGGIDTVRAYVSYRLADNVENLVQIGPGNLSAFGNALDNRLIGNGGDNFLNGDLGADTLGGGAGRDTLLGGGGADGLYGALGDDRLFGGTGRDFLMGGAGRDVLNGGLGGDRFVFNSLWDSVNTAAGRDVITDFNRGQGDRIDLSTIDANQLLAGNQAFELIGANGFSGIAGELRYWQSNSSTFVFGDVDGDRRADISIELIGQMALLERDFIL